MSPNGDTGFLSEIVDGTLESYLANTPELVQRALAVAAEAHSSQLRKDGITAYIVHPRRCVMRAILAPHHFTDEEIAALALHDVIEDTMWPFNFGGNPETNIRHQQMAKIFELFGTEIAGILWLLTKPTDKYYRRKIYMASMRRVGPSVIALKLIDGLDNLEDLPKIARTQEDGEWVEDAKFASFFADKVEADFLPLIDILRMHGPYWENLANWFETNYRRALRMARSL